MPRTTRSSDYKKDAPVVTIQIPIELKAKILHRQDRDKVGTISEWVRQRLWEYIQRYEQQNGLIEPTEEEWARSKPKVKETRLPEVPASNPINAGIKERRYQPRTPGLRDSAEAQ
jgi:hypothetical protein